MEKKARAWEIVILAEGLAAVAGRMEAGEAQRVLGKAASLLIRALEKEADAGYCERLAQGLEAVVGRMATREAARMLGQAASIITRLLEKETRWDLARGLATIAGRMEAHEAARVARQVARILTRAMAKETRASARIWLAHGLAAVARRLSQAEAVTVCNPVVQSLLQAAETETEQWMRHRASETVARLLSAADDPDARATAARMAFVLCSGRDMNYAVVVNGSRLGNESLDALLTDSGRSEMSRRSVAAASFLGLANTTPLSALSAFSAASEPLPCRLSTQDLVELFKMPTCFGEARKVVLKHLGNRYSRSFANHWEFVRFAHEQHLDLLSPPKRPKRP